MFHKTRQHSKGNLKPLDRLNSSASRSKSVFVAPANERKETLIVPTGMAAANLYRILPLETPRGPPLIRWGISNWANIQPSVQLFRVWQVFIHRLAIFGGVSPKFLGSIYILIQLSQNRSDLLRAERAALSHDNSQKSMCSSQTKRTVTRAGGNVQLSIHGPSLAWIQRISNELPSKPRNKGTPQEKTNHVICIGHER